jgi:hypothetical protein
MEPTNSQSQLVINMFAEKVIPSKETTIEDISLLTEAFHPSTSYTFPSLYHNLFDICIVQTIIQDPFQTHDTWPNLNKIQNFHNVHSDEGEDATSSHELVNFPLYLPSTWDQGNAVTNIFLKEYSIILFTYMNKKESC